MRLVISDTTPLNYLILIGHIDVLPKLFGKLLIPPAVVQETGLLDIFGAISGLRMTNFRMEDAVLTPVLEKVRSRKNM